MPAPFIAIPRSSPVSGRLRDHLGELNRVVADPHLGSSLEQIEEGMSELQITPGVMDPTPPSMDNLVGRLIFDNRDLWSKLLTNPFCMKMKEAPKEDQVVLKGFEWYMRQDFLYCIKLMTYEAERSVKAQSSADFSVSTERVKGNADYSNDILKTCTASPPSGLGIPELTVLETRATLALLWYNQFQILVANNTNWVISLVAMIPCIQSYYQIAAYLEEHSIHQDTPWYLLWVKENSGSGSATRQRAFFRENYAQWRDQYEKANEIFQLACQGEINLWATALNPESL